MDPLVLRSYIESSDCFFVEQESDTFICLSERSNFDENPTDRENFWLNIIDFLDEEVITISLSRICMFLMHKGELIKASSICPFKFKAKLPGIIKLKDTLYLQVYVDFYADTYDYAYKIEELETYGCFVQDERVLEEDRSIVNVAMYIPLKNITGALISVMPH